MLLLLILAAPPPPSSAYVQIKNQGVSKGYARTINCSGSGVTCAVNTTTAEATLTVTATTSDAGSSGGNWDGGPAIPACAAGYVLDADGGVLYCVNTIANATLAATATALASNPTDCSTDQYATAIAANGNLTCAQVATSQLSGTITNSQLASSYSGVGSCGSNTWASTLNANGSPGCTQPDFNNIHGQVMDAQLDGGYSGVGACGSHQWASTLSRNASPTCTRPDYTDLSGCEPGQGVAGAVQYNASNCEGGITNLTSDGTHEIVTGELLHPSAPVAGAARYGWVPDAGFPQFPFNADAYLGAAIPHGVLGAFTTGQGGTGWNWQCAKVPGTQAALVGIGNVTPGATNWTTSGPAFSSANLLGRIYWVTGTTGTVPTSGQALIQSSGTAWRGNATSAGGFIFWTRIATHITSAHGRLFFGLQTATSAPFSNVEPSTFQNSAYIGADNGQTTLHACSNDTSGSATCTDLGANFPTTTADAIYDIWLAAAPNGSSIAYYVNRLDTSVTPVLNAMSSDLPQNTVQLRWLDEASPADGGVSMAIYFHGACLAANM